MAGHFWFWAYLGEFSYLKRSMTNAEVSLRHEIYITTLHYVAWRWNIFL